MSNDRPGEPLAYEGLAHDGTRFANAGWRVLRLALILWASIVLIRHASYWLSQVYYVGVSGAVSPARPILFAAAEAVVLAGVLFLAFRSRQRPNSLTPIGTLAIAYIAVNLTAFAIEMAQTGPGVGWAMGLRLIWLLASRVQLLVVPALAVMEWLRR